MKVTAIIDDGLIERVKQATGGKNITESITIALETYLSQQNIADLIQQVESQPLTFKEGFEAYPTREQNRNR